MQITARPLTPLLAGALLAALAGCPAPAPFVRPLGEATIQAVPRIEAGRARRVQAVVAPYTQADVGKVHLILSDVTATPAVVASAAMPAASLGNVITFAHLKLGGTYRIDAEAYATDLATRLDQVATPITINVGNNTVLAPVTVPIRLMDRLFDGTATGEFAFATGAYQPGASADVQVAPGALVSTFSGTGANGVLDGPANMAMFQLPNGFAADASGNVYVSEEGTHTIRMIASNGTVTTLAGAGEPFYFDGAATSAGFNAPDGIAVDASGTIYVADRGNHAIRRIQGGTVDTFVGGVTGGFADGVGSGAALYYPGDLTFGPGGNLYFTDRGNYAVRMVAPDGTVTTLAGGAGGNPGYSGAQDGATGTARFGDLSGLAVDGAGTIYVADRANHAIRRIQGGMVDTVAGAPMGDAAPAGHQDDVATAARFNDPGGLAFDGGGHLLVADSLNHVIRRVALPGLSVTTLAGSKVRGFADAPAPAARFNSPSDLLFLGGSPYVLDRNNRRIRKIDFPL